MTPDISVCVKRWIMAESIGVQDGDIIATSKGLHIYDHAWDLARMVLKEL